MRSAKHRAESERGAVLVQVAIALWASSPSAPLSSTTA